MTDQTVLETKNAILQCEVSKPNVPVTWYKNGIPIIAEMRVEPTTLGTTQLLTIYHTKLEDAAEYSMKVCDDVTSARLTIKGVWLNESLCLDREHAIVCCKSK